MILSDEEKKELINKYHTTNLSFRGLLDDLERLVLSKVSQNQGYNRDSDEAFGKYLSVYSDAAPKQEPIYMWQLNGEEGWIECSKKWFEAHSGDYKTRIVYDHPTLPKAEAIPEYLALGNVGSSDYVKGWNDCIDARLSAAPNQEPALTPSTKAAHSSQGNARL